MKNTFSHTICAFAETSKAAVGFADRHKKKGMVISMKKHIHLFGVSGSGTTAIAAQLSAHLGCAHFDAARYFWLPAAKPFTQERDREECLRLLRRDLAGTNRWVLSGSVTG